MDNTVTITRCASYEPAEVAAALDEAVRPLGGWKALVSKGERVALKVNLLRGSPPDHAVTTHPAVVRAAALAVRAAGGTPFLADSPGAGLPHTRATLEKCYRRSGYADLAEEMGLELNYDVSSRAVHFPGGRVAKRFSIMAPLADADAVINLCKLKTHAFTVLTGAVKNLLGVLPGYDKPAYHARMQTVDNFCEVLVDLALYVRPVLNLMDAVVAMEGNGPGLGTPRLVGLVLASTSALALDVAAGALTGLPPDNHPVLRVAARRGLTPRHPEDLRVAGVPLAAAAIPDWKWPPTLITEGGFANLGPLQRLAVTGFRSAFSVQPRVRRDRCTGCGLCRDTCPVGAVEVVADKSRIEKRLCIRCYCCHEACAYDAIELRRSLLHRLVGRA